MKLFHACASVLWVILALSYAIGDNRDFARAAYCMAFAVWLKVPFDLDRDT